MDLAPVPDGDLATLYDVLTQFVKDEARVQRDQHLRHVRRPIEERVIDERCLAELGAKGEFNSERRTIQFECRSRFGNSARFREGDRLRLHRGQYENGMDVVLTREFDWGIEVRPEASLPMFLDAVRTNKDGWILDEGFFDAEKLLLGGLENAIASDNGRERVLKLFGGGAQSDFGFDLDSLDDSEAFATEAKMNESQADALGLAVSADHCHLVQGPPGTGKTYVLARTVATLVERGERVLVTAFTHRAIHHALRSCFNAIRDEGRMAKIGVPISDASLAPVPQYPSWRKSPMRHIHGGLVIGATPYAATSKRLAEAQFDTIIFDEASQMTVPLAVLAMLKGRKFVFFGDHKQLPPVLQSIPKRDAASWSVFGSLAQNSDVTTLTTTYRLNAALAHWPSENFYSGELHASTGSAERGTPWKTAPTHPALTADASAVFVECEPSEVGGKTAAQSEAETVAEIVHAATEAGLPPDEVGVVAPYRRQSRLIKKLLRRSQRLKDHSAEIVVDTVERFQGQERELIVLSLTTSDLEFLEKVADFYFQEERWNVAATRARSKLVIVGSRTVFEFKPLDSDLEESVALVRSLVERAHAV